MNSIPLIKGNTPQEINTSIIALKKALSELEAQDRLLQGTDKDVQDKIKQINQLIEGINTHLGTVDTHLTAIDGQITALQPVDTVTSGNMHSVTSNAVANIFASRGNVYDMLAGDVGRLILLGHTIGADYWQAFTSLELKGGRVDGYYGSAIIALKRNAEAYGKLLIPMSNISIKIYKKDEQLYVYAYLDTYCRLSVRVNWESHFIVDFQYVASTEGTLIWDNAWV